MGSSLPWLIISKSVPKSMLRTDSSRYARDADFCDQIKDLCKNRNSDSDWLSNKITVFSGVLDFGILICLVFRYSNFVFASASEPVLSSS
jgi:hypothetical protein